MAVLNQKILVSYQINVETSTVEILWSDRLIENGNVLHAENCRGAYELIDGELPECIREAFNISLTSLAHEAVLAFTTTNSDLRIAVGTLEALCSEINADRESLAANVERLTNVKNALLNSLSEKEAIIQELNIQVYELTNKPSEENGGSA
jgi:propanediol dehydratase small subunit